MNILNIISKLFHSSKSTKTRTTVLDILEYADKHRSGGLCISFKTACIHYSVNYESFRKKCKLFRRTPAETFGADSKDLWWWPAFNWITGRADFLKYMIDYYSKKEPVYLE